MAAMFSQNPLMNGPNYSINDTPRVNAPEGAREHRFDPYDYFPS
jgi:20S proteasome subunit beta 6